MYIIPEPETATRLPRPFLRLARTRRSAWYSPRASEDKSIGNFQCDAERQRVITDTQRSPEFLQLPRRDSFFADSGLGADILLRIALGSFNQVLYVATVAQSQRQNQMLAFLRAERLQQRDAIRKSCLSHCIDI